MLGMQEVSSCVCAAPDSLRCLQPNVDFLEEAGQRVYSLCNLHTHYIDKQSNHERINTVLYCKTLFTWAKIVIGACFQQLFLIAGWIIFPAFIIAHKSASITSNYKINTWAAFCSSHTFRSVRITELAWQNVIINQDVTSGRERYRLFISITLRNKQLSTSPFVVMTHKRINNPTACRYKQVPSPTKSKLPTYPISATIAVVFFDFWPWII